MANEIAQTILAQLGGNKFLAMTGARDLCAGSNSLQFKLPRLAKKKANLVRVWLDTDDTYAVEFWNRRGLHLNHVGAPHRGIYAEGLRGFFEAHTGLATSL